VPGPNPTLRVVYYAAAPSTRISNLQALAQQLTVPADLIGFEPSIGARHLFEALPLVVDCGAERSVHLDLITTPSQPVHEPIRRVLLEGADAVVFVADASPSAIRINREAYRGLLGNLRRAGTPDIPTLIQFDQRDPAQARPQERGVGRTAGPESIEACCERGWGVVETLVRISVLAWDAHLLARGWTPEYRDRFIGQLGSLFGASFEGDGSPTDPDIGSAVRELPTAGKEGDR
jgi:hypothetical protein